MSGVVGARRIAGARRRARSVSTAARSRWRSALDGCRHAGGRQALPRLKAHRQLPLLKDALASTRRKPSPRTSILLTPRRPHSLHVSDARFALFNIKRDIPVRLQKTECFLTRMQTMYLRCTRWGRRPSVRFRRSRSASAACNASVEAPCMARLAKAGRAAPTVDASNPGGASVAGSSNAIATVAAFASVNSSGRKRASMSFTEGLQVRSRSIVNPHRHRYCYRESR